MLRATVEAGSPVIRREAVDLCRVAYGEDLSESFEACGPTVHVLIREDDELIAASEVRKFYAPLPEPKELVLIEDANHLFEGKTSLVGDAVEDLLADWTA